MILIRDLSSPNEQPSEPSELSPALGAGGSSVVHRQGQRATQASQQQRRRLLGRSALNRAERSSGAHDDFAPQLQFELWKVRTGCSSKPYLAEPEAWGRSKKPTPMIVAAPFKL
jgi:hypothetical protein